MSVEFCKWLEIVVEPIVAAIRNGSNSDVLEQIANMDGRISDIILRSGNSGTTLSQVPWADLIASASEIDFVVQGWDRWTEHQNIARDLRTFFERGGQFRLYVYEPTSDKASSVRASMAHRIGRGPGATEEEITGTIKNINDIVDRLPPEKRALAKPIEVYRSCNINWYFAALFTGSRTTEQDRARDVMVFSIYSHTPTRRPWDMPAIMIYPDMHADSNMRDWFKGELNHLKEE